ncbi:hypothetical protein JW848_09465 [Candidatus Bipolaricaulota bacterium]|nr:hypothetical protein [Candidatus Bipolaricaulota bacterium]
MAFPAVYALTIGLLMAVQWARTLVANAVPDQGEAFSGRGSLEMAFHWAAEAITAALLLASGAGLLCEAEWAAWLLPLSLGMLLYTVINSPGFFAQRREWRMVVVFGLILAGAVAALVAFVTTERIP